MGKKVKNLAIRGIQPTLGAKRLGLAASTSRATFAFLVEGLAEILWIVTFRVQLYQFHNDNSGVRIICSQQHSIKHIERFTVRAFHQFSVAPRNLG